MGGGMSAANKVAPLAMDKETQEQRKQLMDDMERARKELKNLQEAIRSMKRQVEELGSDPECPTCESVLSLSFENLRKKLKDVSGVQVDNASRCIFIPFDAPLSGALMLGLDYGNTIPKYRVYKIDARPDLFVDLVCSNTGGNGIQLHRDIYPDGRVLMEGLVVFEEISLAEMPVEDYTAGGKGLTILVYNTKITMKTNVWEVAKSCGWKGMMNFEQASKKLQGVDIDYKKRDIYMPAIPDELIVIADYKARGMAIKLGVLDVAENDNKGHDLSITSGKNIRKASEVHIPPQKALNGKYSFSQTFALIDVPFGTNFNQMSLHQYDLVDKKEFRVAKLVHRLL